MPIAWIEAFGISHLGHSYNRANRFRKRLNPIVAAAFVPAGIYIYLYYV